MIFKYPSVITIKCFPLFCFLSLSRTVFYWDIYRFLICSMYGFCCSIFFPTQYVKYFMILPFLQLSHVVLFVAIKQLMFDTNFDSFLNVAFFPSQDLSFGLINSSSCAIIILSKQKIQFQDTQMTQLNSYAFERMINTSLYCYSEIINQHGFLDLPSRLVHLQLWWFSYFYLNLKIFLHLMFANTLTGIISELLTMGLLMKQIFFILKIDKPHCFNCSI